LENLNFLDARNYPHPRERTLGATRLFQEGDDLKSLMLSGKIKNTLSWLPVQVWQRTVRRVAEIRPLHLIIGIADHFEPAILPGVRGQYANRAVQERRLQRWCREYPAALNKWRDEEGFPLRHTYFYPAEQYDEGLVHRLAEHCHEGWGEIEIHLHHGVAAPDTEANTRRVIVEFRDSLAACGCLSQENGSGPSRYAFVHGNWALANSAGGRYCGVDNEMQILSDTGCYADFTLPSAPAPGQVDKINSLYECSLPLNRRAPHRRGLDLRRGQPPQTFPLIIQGPLLVSLSRRKRGWPFPGIENSELSGANPPTLRRLQLWRDAGISVRGRPDWLFIKLHCHGMDPRDESAMFGEAVQRFLQELIQDPGRGDEYKVHFVTMREMVNIILAACDGCEGTPADFRDYRFRLIRAAVRHNS
jgi:hypothetical protein